MAKFAFTLDRLAKQKPPATGRVYHYDAKTPGLALCITAKGTRTFYVARRVNGKYERILIGHTPPITLEKARDAAVSVHNKILDGKDPQHERRAAREEMTVGQLWEKYKAEWLEV